MLSIQPSESPKSFKVFRVSSQLFPVIIFRWDIAISYMAAAAVSFLISICPNIPNSAGVVNMSKKARRMTVASASDRNC